MSEVAGSTEARSQSLNPPYLRSTATEKMKMRRTVTDSVANVGESGDRNRCLGTSVAYLGVKLIRAPSNLADAGKARLPVGIVCSPR